MRGRLATTKCYDFCYKTQSRWKGNGRDSEVSEGRENYTVFLKHDFCPFLLHNRQTRARVPLCRSQLWLVHSLELEVSEHFHDELDGPDVVTQNQVVPGVASRGVINVPELVRHG